MLAQVGFSQDQSCSPLALRREEELLRRNSKSNRQADDYKMEIPDRKEIGIWYEDSSRSEDSTEIQFMEKQQHNFYFKD